MEKTYAVERCLPSPVRPSTYGIITMILAHTADEGDRGAIAASLASLPFFQV